MITIVKGDKKLIVSKSGFDEYYKNMGWEVEGGSKKTTKSTKAPVEEKVEPVENAEETSDEEDWSEFEDEVDDSEKPLSEMNKTELKEKATSLGIDISGDYTDSQLRDMIKEALK